MGPVNVCLKEHIKSSIFGNIFSGIEKAVNTFSIPEKFFPKMIYYCMPLEHTLVKSFILIADYVKELK